MRRLRHLENRQLNTDVELDDRLEQQLLFRLLSAPKWLFANHWYTLQSSTCTELRDVVTFDSEVNGVKNVFLYAAQQEALC